MDHSKLFSWLTINRNYQRNPNNPVVILRFAILTPERHRNGQKNFDSKLSTKKDIFFLHENLTEILPYIIFI
jgi:hypothetical protein